MIKPVYLYAVLWQLYLYILKSDLIFGTDKTKLITKGHIQSSINNVLEAKLMELRPLFNTAAAN